MWSWIDAFRNQMMILAGAVVFSLFSAPASAANVSEFLGYEAVNWNNTVINISPIAEFYQAREGRGVWTHSQGLTENGHVLLKLVRNAEQDGLEARDYLGALPQNPERLTTDGLRGLELYLSQVFVAFGRDLFAGRTTPSVSDPEIVIPRKEFDPVEWLQRAADNGPAAVYSSLRPSHPQYAQLRQMLAGYRNLERLGGWPSISEGPTLKPGMTDLRVAEMRSSLQGRGYQGLGTAEPELFDDALVEVVKHFQTRHGLEVDGVAGPATVKAMSHSVEYRIQQIITNMERWRWLPRELGRKHVFVNQAAFNLHIRKDGQVTDRRKVIVGKEFHRTPMFSDQIRYAEFNPTWTVPSSIAGRAILPKIRQNPAYLEANDYRLYTSWKSDAPAMSPYSIDWASVNPKRFPYRIVQRPGRKNALGQVKFMFPNKFAVYLHDTSNRELFAKSRRAYSSGCIRVHRPMEFAEKLFGESGNLPRAKIDSILDSRKTTRVDLKQSVPVHLTYFTVWLNENGVPNFYEDIYGRDKLVSNLLFGKV